MAATETPVSTSVVLVSNIGKTATGRNIIKKTSLSKIATTAADQDIYDVATAIGNILNFPVSEIDKVSHSVLTNA
jgi:hypothetical protein